MANDRNDPLTLKIGGIEVKGKLITDLDTGIGKWYPISGPTGPFSVLGNKYLTSIKNPDGTWDAWRPVGDVFGEIRNQNSQIASAYGTTDKVAEAFYIAGNGLGSPTGTLNNGRLNQFTTYGAPQTAKNLGIPGAVNTGSGGGGGGGGAPPPTDPKSIPSLPINSEIANNEKVPPRTNYGADKDLAYPLNRSDEQDYIKFTMFKYDGRELGGEQGITKDNISTFKPGPRRLKQLDGSVTLPIQPSITDSNGVEWGGANLSGPDAYLASLALGGMNSREGLTGMLSTLMGRVQQDLKEIAGSTDFQNAIKLYLAQEAVGVQGLLSRATGAIINPNLELLFNGPTLRPFNFAFRLSPRNEEEAKNVKRIIRFFKEGMSVQTAASNIFLKAPNLFDISYVGKSSSSLNKIKTCALLGCDVDYTPDGSYMTFNDGTMTSYQLTLRFSEVDPIYSEDYSGLSETEIGY